MILDHCTFPGNWTHTPPLSQHFAQVRSKCYFWLRGGVGGSLLETYSDPWFPSHFNETVEGSIFLWTIFIIAALLGKSLLTRNFFCWFVTRTAVNLTEAHAYYIELLFFSNNTSRFYALRIKDPGHDKPHKIDNSYLVLYRKGVYALLLV